MKRNKPMNGMARIALAACCLVTLSAARGADITWTNEAGGDFSNPLNWNPNQVPGAADVAVFDLTGPEYRVYWSESVTNMGYKVNAGSLIWDFQGHTYTYTNRYNWNFGTGSSGADLTIMNGAGSGRGASSAGAMPIISGPGTIVTVLTNTSFALQEHKIYAPARVVVDGPNAIFGYGQCRYLSGTIIVTNGGLYKCGGQFYAYAGAVVVISGRGSTMTSNTTGFYTGTDGGISISDGGYWYVGAQSDISITEGTHMLLDDGCLRVNSKNLLNKGGFIDGQGIVTSTFYNVSGHIRPGGTNGVGQLTFVGPFHNNIAETNGTIQVELGGTAAGASDRLEVIGTLYAGGILDVRLLDDYRPASGDTFDILDFTAVDGEFETLDLPGAEANWDLTQLYVTGEIRYRPVGTVLMVQ